MAAFKNHLSIVQYLVGKKADISAKTTARVESAFTGLAPLHGALLDRYLEEDEELTLAQERQQRGAVVRFLLESGADLFADVFRPFDGEPIWMSRLCAIDSITALIDHGLDVNHRALNKLGGKTILHFWVGDLEYITEEEALAVVQFLLDRGADLHVQDSNGFTPIFNAAMGLNVTVLDFLLKRNDISRREKVEALELAGAKILLDPSTITCPLLLAKAFDYWRQSLHLRLMETDECGPILKSQRILKTVQVVEWATEEELEHVIQHPSEHVVQSFLVLSRIFSLKSWIAVQGLFEKSFSYIFRLVKQHRFAESLDILWSMLEMIRSRYNAREEGLCKTALEVVDRLIYTLRRFDLVTAPPFPVEIIRKSLKTILATDQFLFGGGASINGSLSYMNSILGLFKMLANHPLLVMNDEDSVESLLSNLICDSFNGKLLLLHLACQENDQFSDRLATLRLLLRVGANPNKADANDNTSVHFLALNNPTDEASARLLLDSGAFLDRRNYRGQTAADAWIEKNNLSGDLDADLPGWLRDSHQVPKLFLQSGRVIRSKRIPYLHLPPSLHPFIELQHKVSSALE